MQQTLKMKLSQGYKMDYKPSLATLVEDLEVQRNYYKQEVDNLYIYLNSRGLSDDEIDEIAQGEIK